MKNKITAGPDFNMASPRGGEDAALLQKLYVRWPDLERQEARPAGTGSLSRMFLFGDCVVKVADPLFPHLVEQEAAVLDRVAAAGVPAPRVLDACEDPPAVRMTLAAGSELAPDLLAALPPEARTRAAQAIGKAISDIASCFGEGEDFTPAGEHALTPARMEAVKDVLGDDFPAAARLAQSCARKLDALPPIVFHADLTQHNILADREGNVTLIDFGLMLRGRPDQAFVNLERACGQDAPDFMQEVCDAFARHSRLPVEYRELRFMESLRALSAAVESGGEKGVAQAADALRAALDTLQTPRPFPILPAGKKEPCP